MLRCAQSARSNVLLTYACARRSFARLASEVFLSSLPKAFLTKLLGTVAIGSTLMGMLLDPHYDEHADAQRAVSIGHGDLDRQALRRLDE